ncbi:MAG: toxin-antitoxin system HicB family antitoxin [Thermodesulfovibrio sp.]|nr:toxin-antitoxin system HicB family antitoxin [Thermodesulfovibrio sp.]
MIMRYPMKVFYSEEDKGFIAVVLDLPGCSAFGETEEDAVREARTAEQLWLETAKKQKRKIPAPSTEETFSGRILARTPKSLHRALTERAKEEGVSLNQLVVYLLSSGVQQSRHA